MYQIRTVGWYPLSLQNEGALFCMVSQNQDTTNIITAATSQLKGLTLDSAKAEYFEV